MSVSGKSFRVCRPKILEAASRPDAGVFERVQLALEEQLGAYWEYQGSVTIATAEEHRKRIVLAIIRAMEGKK